MTCLAALAHSYPFFPASSSSLNAPPRISPCFEKPILVLQSNPSGHIIAQRVLNSRFRSIHCFKEDDSGHNIEKPQIAPVPTVGKKNQEALLKRIAHEVRRKRKGDRDSTPLVRALTWTCREAQEVADVEPILAGLELELSIFSSALQKLGIEGRPKAAIAVFDWVKSSSGRRPNVYTYNSLLGALKANEWYEKAQTVFDGMQLNGVHPDVVTYNTLINLYEKQGRFDDALEVFNNLPSRGVHPTLFTFRNIIQILAKKRDTNTALDIFREFKQRLWRVDENVVQLKRNSEQRRELEATMAQLCCDEFASILLSSRDNEPSRQQNALKFLSRLKGAQIQLDAHSYERLILACGEKERDHKVVRVLYADMRCQQLQMSASVCNHVIGVLSRGKRWWAALEVFENMVETGPEPDAFTRKLLLRNFRILLTSARNRKIWKWAMQLIDKMIKKGLEPDEFSWNAALISCSKAGETAAAVLVFQKMIDRGQKPGILSYGALLSAFEKSSSLSEAELLWEHMQNMGLKPNIVAYTTMVTLYGNVGRYSDATRLVEEMREAGIQPSVVTFNALITACAKAGDGERALGLVEQMKTEWVQPDPITYAQLIEALANEGKWESAIATLTKMQKLKMEPPGYAYDAVIRVCRANSIPLDLHLQPEHSFTSASIA